MDASIDSDLDVGLHDESEKLEFNEAMAVTDLSNWLSSCGIPPRFCRVFEGSFIIAQQYDSLL